LRTRRSQLGFALLYFLFHWTTANPDWLGIDKHLDTSRHCLRISNKIDSLFCLLSLIFSHGLHHTFLSPRWSFFSERLQPDGLFSHCFIRLRLLSTPHGPNFPAVIPGSPVGFIASIRCELLPLWPGPRCSAMSERIDAHFGL
jgi:hypothetical protein